MRQKTVPDSPLKNIRETRTLRQHQLASLARVSQQTISKAERGLLIPRVDVQDRLAAILGVTRHDLFPTEQAAS